MIYDYTKSDVNYYIQPCYKDIKSIQDNLESLIHSKPPDPTYLSLQLESLKSFTITYSLQL